MQTEIRHGLCLCAWIFLYCTLPTAARGRLSCRRIMCWGAYGFKDVYEVHGGGPPSLKLRRDIRLHRSRDMGCQFIPPKPECGERRRRMAEGRGLGTNRLCFCNAARRSFEKPCAIPGHGRARGCVPRPRRSPAGASRDCRQDGGRNDGRNGGEARDRP